MKQGEFNSIMLQSRNSHATPRGIEERARRVQAKLDLKAFKGMWTDKDIKRWQFVVSIVQKCKERRQSHDR